ncbi:MAG: hypothetical protein HY902_18120 [Deltaproteobacteria bacterium]|nr:hypothetical protein [Deltaproteobacteria bacterium]
MAQPFSGSQWSNVQTLPSSQALGSLPAQALAPSQADCSVQALPSSQAAPLAVALNSQPVAGLQVSSVQALPSLQATAVPPLHAPVWQDSPAVQAFPSLQAPVVAACAHPLAASQLSTVQGLLSLQSTIPVWPHVPDLQASPVVQASPSSQAAELAGWAQPADLSQAGSSVQGLLSAHTTALPPLQVPPWHVSPLVHASPSSHAPDVGVLMQPVPGEQVSLVQILSSSQSLQAFVSAVSASVSWTWPLPAPVAQMGTPPASTKW